MKLAPKLFLQKVENANYAVTVGKAMGLSMVNVGGPDIANGSRKIILAIIGQLVRKYVKQKSMIIIGILYLTALIRILFILYYYHSKLAYLFTICIFMRMRVNAYCHCIFF